MFLAVVGRLATLDIKRRALSAGFMTATLFVNIHHAVVGVFLAVNGRLGSFEIKRRAFSAGGVPAAALVVDIYHAVFCVLPAVHRDLASRYVK